MPRSTLLGFPENTGTATFAQGLTFIERTRRQLDRFDCLPHAPGESIAPEDAAEIRCWKPVPFFDGFPFQGDRQPACDNTRPV